MLHQGIAEARLLLYGHGRWCARKPGRRLGPALFPHLALSVLINVMSQASRRSCHTIWSIYAATWVTTILSGRR